MRFRSKPLTVTVSAAALVVMLAGCTPDASEPSPGTETVTATVTPTPTSTPTPSAAPAPPATSTPGPDGESGGGGDLGDGTIGAAADRCTVDELQGAIDDGGGGAAGSYGVALILTNTGDRTCELQGWPGVSFVGGGDGTQLGASATLDRASEHPTVQIAPGGYAQAILTMVQAANYDAAECQPQQSEGFRVYPPGSTASLYIGAGGDLFTACTSSSVQQLSVGAIQPGP
ncbi:DUF4232 domain-containing protein [Frigoribacterium sp. CFBP9039]|uniref:DUF4232 domain-containing protein n=1 Tax=unclassified Frigoribacterium TaxID=2627005 RepID=UPI0017862C50|nr:MULTISPECIES: DUF4232 domain-containing protein [unclassified Frigoribacterium]MBD8703946.1 DUF4232 domain-containing protein [Frigoribacterium sp. CFBP 13712]MDY0892212.1 DUF4232 domain-containing protein [Frigoribacterium sp. CFBP9030]MDY0947005.1 DUF4232 domain-containing protein [Frigoribacterium sp. CFBP9039]